MMESDSEVRREVRRALEKVGDSVGPPRPFDVVAHEDVGQRVHRSSDSRRALAAAGAGVAVVAPLAGLVVLQGDAQPSSIKGTDTTEPSPTTIPDVATSPSTLLPTSVAASPTTLPIVREPTVEEPTIEDVRKAQAEALRQLVGFTAVAEVTQTFGSEDQQPASRVAKVPLLPDGSFWAQIGADEWGSYDPASGVARSAFRGADGTIQYQEIVGQRDNSVPVGVLTGMNPVQLVDAIPGVRTDIAVTVLDVRPVWEITTVMTYDPSSCEELCEGDPFVQTMVDTVDQATGLVIRSSNTTTEVNGTSQVAVLRDIRVVDTVPAAFPGTVPDGAEIDRSGEPTAAVSATLGDVADFFGVPVPIPSGVGEATVNVSQNESLDPSGAVLVNRRAEIVGREGFLMRSVYISALAASDEGESRGGVVDGYLCMTGDDDNDGTCDPDPYLDQTPLVDGQQIVTIDEGAAAGTRALAIAGTISFSSGPFSIVITAASTAEALAIANSLQLS
jgi:hypothetical protein